MCVRSAIEGDGVSSGDQDGDGDLGAFFAKYGSNTVWVNEGLGKFSGLHSLTDTQSSETGLTI